MEVVAARPGRVVAAFCYTGGAVTSTSRAEPATAIR